MANQAPADIVNRALNIVGNNIPPVTGVPPLFDGSTAGLAAGVLYNGAVQTVGRQFGWDFSRSTVALTASGGVPPSPWAYEYLYPTSWIQLRQVSPVNLAEEGDVNNPLPTRWAVGYSTIAGVVTKVVWSNLSPAQAIFSGSPPESLWDSLFTEAVVRQLGQELAMAVAGRPETARDVLETAAAFEKVAEGRQD